MAAPDMTICSVYHDAFTRSCLEMNIAATAKRNPRQSIPWVVTDNAPEGLPPLSLPENVTVVPGKAPDLSIPASVRGSYHHGTAINQSIEPVTTRWMLILDVDFFVILEEWAAKITTHADEAGIAFFGTTWHPRWFNKYRYFPSVHYLLIDLDRVAGSALDFRPDLLDHLPLDPKPASEAESSPRGSRLRTIARNLITVLLLRDRRVISSSRDTGYRLYEKFGRDSRHAAEHLRPVYRPDEQFEGPRYALGPLNRMVERLLPEHLCYFPKRSDAFSLRSFRDLGAIDALSHGWEEFLWRGEPFAFHFRGYQNRADDDQALIDLRHALGTFNCVEDQKS